jgi:hypothetical protein
MTMGGRAIPAEVHGGGRFLLRRRDFTPAYLKAHEDGRLRDKVEEALAHLGPSYRACPRLCKGVDRRADQYGVCKVGRHARVASAFAHFGEEDVLRGWRGYWRQYRPKGWLFPGRTPAGHRSLGQVQRLTQRAVRAAGIAKKASLHTLRETLS